MNTKSTNLDTFIAPGTTPKPRFLDKIAKRSLLSRLKGLHDGEIVIQDEGEVYRFGKTTTRCPLSVIIKVKSPNFYSDIAFGGSIGAGEAYMANYWQANNLTRLVRILLCNRDVLDSMEGGLAALTVPMQKIFHWFNRNTQQGSRSNIAAHYDIGNDFFELMLDDTMMYSSAIFPSQDASLFDAQVHRLDRICGKLDLQPSDHLLEIGTGWGGLALYAAKQYGCKVTTTTISREQYELARERVKAEGLEDRVTLMLEDYRNLNGQYDKLVSIEMIEAVGHQFYDTYFAKCGSLLKPDGIMLLQAITIADQFYENAKKSVDFIQRYIFPGSCIPSVTAITDSVARTTDMRLFDLEDIGPHYATTLRKWRENVNHHLSEISAMGYSNEFLRMWEFYLCYCEGGFIDRSISDVHMLLVKPDNRSIRMSYRNDPKNCSSTTR
jgi:cyclopropane-fatty-acyl-phospholipid synthase